MRTPTILAASLLLAAASTAHAQWVQGTGFQSTSDVIGIGTSAPRTPLEVWGASGFGIIRAEQNASGGPALLGWSKATSGFCYGVYGQSHSVNGYGVYGWATNPSGPTVGVYGQSDSPTGYAGLFKGGLFGVYAWPTATSGQTVGVYGIVSSPNGWGGIFKGGLYGVWGETNQSNGYAGYFVGRTFVNGRLGVGVPGPSAMIHVSSTDETSLLALNTATTGLVSGGTGQIISTSGFGLLGKSLATSGQGSGLGGQTSAPNGYGAIGQNTSTNNSGTGGGLFGQSNLPGGSGVYGWHDSGSGSGQGILGVTRSNTGTGIYGSSEASSGVTDGVFGGASSSSGSGVTGSTSSSNVNAFGMYCNGRLAASGTKSFQIDHPLDPAHKFLNHFSAEGPEPYLIYRGNAVLDAQGFADVALPDYFEAVNRDFQYQLTPIGAPAVLYVAQEVKGNTFRIGGGSPGMKVSWTVTGIRNDAFVRENPMPAEADKPAEMQGRYLRPDLYGASWDSALRWRTAPAKPAIALPRPTKPAAPASVTIPATPAILPAEGGMTLR